MRAGELRAVLAEAPPDADVTVIMQSAAMTALGWVAWAHVERSSDEVAVQLIARMD